MSQSTNEKKNPAKQAPWYAVPTILGILMVSSGLFVFLLAHGIKVFDSMNY